MALKGTGGSGKLGNQEKSQNHLALGTIMLKRIGTWGWFVCTVLLNNIDMNEPLKDSTQEIMLRGNKDKWRLAYIYWTLAKQIVKLM